MDGMEWNCVRDGCKASPLLSNSDNPTKPEVFGLQNNKKKINHRTKVRGFRWPGQSWDCCCRRRGVARGSAVGAFPCSVCTQIPALPVWSEHYTCSRPPDSAFPHRTGLSRAAESCSGSLGTPWWPPDTWPCCSDVATVWSLGCLLWGHRDSIHIPLWSQTCCWPQLLQTDTLSHTQKKTNSSYFPHIFFFP